MDFPLLHPVAAANGRVWRLVLAVIRGVSVLCHPSSHPPADQAGFLTRKPQGPPLGPRQKLHAVGQNESQGRPRFKGRGNAFHLWICEPHDPIAKEHGDGYGGLLAAIDEWARAALTEWHRPVGVNKRNPFFFFTVLEAGNSRSRCWPVCFLLKSLSLACSWPFLYKHTSQVSLPLLIRTPVLLNKGPTLLTSVISLRSLSPNTVTLGVRASTHDFEGHNSVHRVILANNLPSCIWL